MNNYQFHEALMLRTPSFSYIDFNLSEIDKVVHDPFFKGALYLANPTLHRLLTVKSFQWDLFTAKEKLSIAKYYNRMAFRPTPFGVFSAFGKVNWGNEKQIRLANFNNNRLHLLFDQDVNQKLLNGLLTPDSSQCVLPNPTLYRVASDFRFIKTSQEAGSSSLTFSLESLEINQLLLQLVEICKNGTKSIDDLVPLVSEVSMCNLDVALDYVLFLVSSQWLIFKLRLNIIGEDYPLRLFNSEHFKGLKDLKELQIIYQKILKISIADDNELLTLTKQINGLLSKLKQPVASNIFYAGLEHIATNGCIKDDWQEPLKATISAVNRLTVLQLNPALINFIQHFKKKFDRQKVPLMHAIDPYIGIGYAELENDAGSPLLDQLRFGKKSKSSSNLQWSPVHQLLISRWVAATTEGQGIVINEHDLNRLDVNPEIALSNISVMFRLVDEANFLLEAIVGGPATALIGRFTVWSKDIYCISKQIANLEQETNSEVLFAEIAQLSDTHADNINRRMHLYDYEIPINSVSLLPKENQIALSDLLVYIIDDKIMLESVSKKKIIIPRLSSAYNYARNELAVFRFLCDLQYQGMNIPAVPDLEKFFPGLSFYPRLSYNNAVLSLAKWYLETEQILELSVKDKLIALQRLEIIKSKLHWPDLIAIVKHDQQIVINLKNEVEVEFFLQVIRGASQLLIQEVLLPPSGYQPVIDENNRSLINQFVAFLYNEREIYHEKIAPDQSRSGIKQTDYILGSKWLYLKLYCNPAISNFLLIQKILPIIEKLKIQFNIGWFFIRYRDDGYHIRLRIKASEQNIGHIIKTLKRKLVKDVRIQLVRQYQADTYQPEWERYGADLMNSVESLFGASSDLVLVYLKRSIRMDFKWPYYSLAFISTAEMISVFIPELNHQINFIEQMAESFYQEFSEDKLLKIDLNDKYRELKGELKSLLDDENYYQKLKISRQHQFFLTELTRLANMDFGNQPDRKNILLADLIHMHLNRLFVDEQRKQELVVYYCLLKLKTTIKVSGK